MTPPHGLFPNCFSTTAFFQIFRQGLPWSRPLKSLKTCLSQGLRKASRKVILLLSSRQCLQVFRTQHLLPIISGYQVNKKSHLQPHTLDQEMPHRSNSLIFPLVSHRAMFFSPHRVINEYFISLGTRFQSSQHPGSTAQPKTQIAFFFFFCYFLQFLTCKCFMLYQKGSSIPFHTLLLVFMKGLINKIPQSWC